MKILTYSAFSKNRDTFIFTKLVTQKNGKLKSNTFYDISLVLSLLQLH